MTSSREIFVLVEKETKIKEMDADFLVRFIQDGYSVYDSSGHAEEARQNCAAYDNPGLTRVVGFRVSAFLPKTKNKKERK